MPEKATTMKLKLDDAGHAVLQDGKPVYVHDDGKEVAFDAAAAVAKIGLLNGEAQGHREAKEKAEKALKAFEGIEDPAVARKAIETLSNLDQKKLVDAGEVQKVKDEAIKAVRAEYEPVIAERDALKGHLDKEIRGGAFARSKFAEEKVAVPRHMLERTYGDNFKIEDGKLVPYDAAGSKLYSRTKPGEVADFEEALELLISADPYRDSILKGTGAKGSGAEGGGGGGSGTKTMPRSQFDALPQADRAAKIKDGFTLTD